MGGSNETKISGLRFHVSGGDVHAHNDAGSMKFRRSSSEFKSDLKGALDALKKQDGVIKIEGDDNTDLCVVNDSGDISLFLTGGSSVKRQLQDFMRKC